MAQQAGKRYRIGVAGFAHMHVNELVDRFLATGRADLVACADTLPCTPSLTRVEGSRHANLHRALAKPGHPCAYDDYREMLRQERPDIVILCPEISRHAEVAEEAASHGAHLVTEKPLAATVADAEKAAEWWHQAEAGGGALLDYCCYGACLATWFLGTVPDSVQGLTANLYSSYGTAEDNAALLLRYPRAIGLIEASWTTFHIGVANGPILYGTHGTIVVDGPKVLLYKERGAATPTAVFEGDPLPAGRATIAEEFLHHIETGAALHPTLDVPLNLAAVAILDAGARAARSGRAEPVEQHPLPAPVTAA